MDRYGTLCSDSGSVHIPDWYRWERSEAVKEAENGYDMTFPVDVEALPNEKGFVPLGKGTLRHSAAGYELTLDTKRDMPDKFPVRISTQALYSVQTEYDYRCKGKPQCIVISTQNCCYYCYCSDPRFIVTKQEFIQEYLYDRLQKKT